MKKNIIFCMTILSCLFASNVAMAQNSTSFGDKILAEFGVGTSFMQHKTTSTLYDIKAGYKVLPYLSLYADFENNVNIEGSGDYRHVFYTNALGGGINFDFLANTDNSIVCSLSTSLGTSVDTGDYKQTVYKAGIKLRLGKDKIHPTLEFGYRGTHARTDNLKNSNGIYATLGISW